MMLRRAAIIAVLAAPCAAPAHAQDDLDKVWTKIQPHRAVYTLRQKGSDRGSDSGPTIAGRMVTETRLTCGEMVSSMTLELRATSGAQTTSVMLEQKGTESRDGKVYRFSSRTAENGRISESREGQAVLETRNGPGEAKIKGATAEDVKIEAGTILPGTHILRMMAAAAAGQKSLEHRAGWTIREEHKEQGGSVDAATQTSEMFVTEEAVATAITIQVQNLELVGTVLSIEKLPKSECK
jgi:hypothetical protein